MEMNFRAYKNKNCSIDKLILGTEHDYFVLASLEKNDSDKVIVACDGDYFYKSIQEIVLSSNEIFELIFCKEVFVILVEHPIKRIREKL